MSLDLLEKHLFVTTDQRVIFIFTPEDSVLVDEDEKIFPISSTIKVINFFDLLEELELDITEQNALALVVSLITRRQNGEFLDFA